MSNPCAPSEPTMVHQPHPSSAAATPKNSACSDFDANAPRSALDQDDSDAREVARLEAKLAALEATVRQGDTANISCGLYTFAFLRRQTESIEWPNACWPH